MKLVIHNLTQQNKQQKKELKDLITLKEDLKSETEHKSRSLQKATAKLSELQLKVVNLTLSEIFTYYSTPPTRALCRIAELRNYRLEPEKLLLRGCSGCVCQALLEMESLRQYSKEDTEIRVALKMMIPYTEDAQLYDTKQQKESFDSEYFFLISYPHWSMVQVYNYFRSITVKRLLELTNVELGDYIADRTTFFTMELGKSSLESYLKSRSLDLREGLLIILQMLISVEHLHSMGFAHLDIKCDNVLLVERERIRGNMFVLADLGTAAQAKLTAACAGNPANRSPEFSRGTPTFNKPVDVSKNDLWAIGCIMYQMFTGEHPFVDKYGNTQEKVLYHFPTLSHDSWGFGTNQLLQCLLQKVSKDRVEPSVAVCMCCILLWGCPAMPSYDPPTGGYWKGSYLKNEDNLKNFRANITDLTLDVCQTWLDDRRFELYSTYFDSDERPKSIPIELMLKINFLVNTNADTLRRAVLSLATGKAVHTKLL